MNTTRQVLLDSSKLKPLSTKGLCVPELEISKTFSPKILSPVSPKKSNTPTRITPIDNANEEKLSKLGVIDNISKKQIIENFDNKIYSFMFWTCVQTKNLGTFLVVKTPDNKMHFISMRQKLNGCNFQYDFIKKCIYTKDCDGCEFKSISDTLHYEFPEEAIVLTPDEPYEIPNTLSKM